MARRVGALGHAAEVGFPLVQHDIRVMTITDLVRSRAATLIEGFESKPTRLARFT